MMFKNQRQFGFQINKNREKGNLFMLKSNFFLSLFLIFNFVINTGNAAEPEKHLVILYTSDTKSYIEGCG